MDELYFQSTTTLAWRIREREVSSEEVVRSHLERIEQVNPRLNALVTERPEAALEDARAADAALARGEILGPLHGVPVSIKDWLDVAGLRCTAGFAPYRDRIATEDATVVTRIGQAGAIILGKTNVMVDNEVYGRANNPYNPAYSTTGSSSGEAALIAAGGSPLGLGSDSGGSIRQPAHACGIAGLKPTSGRVPLTGHFPFISAINDPRTVIGPLARFVEDLALVVPIISGVDWKDASVIPMPLGDWRSVDVRSLRLAFYTHHEGANPTPETVETCRRTAVILSNMGVRVEEALPPRIEESARITREYWVRPESESPDEWMTSEEFKLSSSEVEEHLFRWDRFRRSLTAFMGDYDAILTPVAEKPATPHGTDAGWIPYTLPYSLSGFPCSVVRAGTSPDGMPIGVQFAARPWREDVALALAHVIEQECGGWQAPNMD